MTKADKEKQDKLVNTSITAMAQTVAPLSHDERTVVEWAANTVLTTATEYTLAVDEVLHSDFHFSDAQIDDFHEALRHVLSSLGEVHSYGNHPMTPQDMAVVGEIAKAKAPYEKALILQKKLGIALPSLSDPLGVKKLIN